MVSLALSLVYDLQLNKPMGELSLLCRDENLPTPKQYTLEERRAVLAFFFLSSKSVPFSVCFPASTT